MKLRALFIATLCFMFSQMSFAMPPKPDACPKASALQAGGLMMAQKDPEGRGYIAFNLGSYNTPEQWGFAMGLFQASNEMEALVKALDALPSVRGNPSPMPIEQQNVWACLYAAKDGYQAIAFTPLPSAKAAGALLR